MAHVRGLGHVGLYVQDLQRAREFYTRLLGLQVVEEDAERGMVFLSARPQQGHQEHDLLLMVGRSAPQGVRVLQQVAFRVEGFEDLLGLYRRFTEEGIPVLEVVDHYNSLGFYVRDPDGNLVEVYWLTGAARSGPYARSVDLERPPQDLLARASRPGP